MKKNLPWLCGLIAVGILLVVVAGIALKEFKKSNTAKYVSMKQDESDTGVANAGTENHKDGKKNCTKPKLPREMPKTQTDQEVGNALKKYASTDDPDEKIVILNNLALVSNKKILDLVYKALDDPSDDVRIAAAMLFEDFGDNAIIPAVSKALNDKDEEVRLIAMNALGDVDSPETLELLRKGIGDDSEVVRDAVFSVLSDKDSATKEAILGEAIRSKFRDVKEKVQDLAIETPSHKTMEMLIEALQDGDEGFRADIFSTITVFFSEEFKTYEEAKNWWIKNKDRYDDELFEK
ncbi:MAG: HEAT repeat domain-containing protein [Lentisphaerae bacterium]|nr:HEAT repeat domain-containing protein [Lentisphaerota bacterium]